MRLTGSRAYYRPSPPQMPSDLVELMEGLTKEVLKHNPADVYGFCAGHMQHLLEIRDGPPRKKLITLEEKVAQAQQKVRQRAQMRMQQYSNKLLLKELESNNYADEKVMSEHVAETSSVLTKQNLTNITEIGMYREIINGEVISLNGNIINDDTVNSDKIKSSILGETTKLESKFISDSKVIEVFNKNYANVDLTFHGVHENANEENESYDENNTDDQKSNVHKYNAIGNGQIQLPEINIEKQNDEVYEDNIIVKNISEEQVPHLMMDKECTEIQKVLTVKTEHASEDHPNILNDNNDTERINMAMDAESVQINSETNQVERSAKHMPEGIDTPELNLLSSCLSKNDEVYEDNIIIKNISEEQVPHLMMDKECTEIQKVLTVKTEHASEDHPNILNDNNDTERINMAMDAESVQINSETNQVERSAKHMPEGIDTPELNLLSSCLSKNDEVYEDNIIVKNINEEQVSHPIIDKECTEIQKEYTIKTEYATEDHPNILNDNNDKECINVAVHAESMQIYSETNQVERSDRHMPELNLLSSCSSNGVKNIDTSESNLMQSMSITKQDDPDTKEQITIVPINEENTIDHENKAPSITKRTLDNDDLVAKSNCDKNELSMIEEESKDSNFSHIDDFLIIKEIDKDFSTSEIKDAIKETQIQSHGIEDEAMNRNEVIKESNILNSPVSGNEENIVQCDLKQKNVNEFHMKSPSVISQDTTDANIKNDTQIITDARTTNIDTDIKNNACNVNDNSNMDLETAAVTIQKVFRSFLFKSRASTFDDVVNDEENLDEDNEKKDDSEFLILNPQSVERRPHCITRMDTVLQTVNEEKSLSLSTDDSSTLSSAATIIQAHVRGFLVRNKLNSNKTGSTNSFPASNSNDPSLTSLENDNDQNKNKTILNIHIVPEEVIFLSRDESFVTSTELSLDGSPPSSVNLHPLGYDKSERRKQLKREDAIQSISPPSNNSGKLSEDVDSIKENLMNNGGSNQQQVEGLINKARNDVDEETLVGNNVMPDEIDNIKEIAVKYDTHAETTMQRRESLMKMNSDEMDVVMPFTSSETKETSESKLMHTGEFHDLVLPTRVARSDTTVVREFKSVLVYFLLWNPA